MSKWLNILAQFGPLVLMLTPAAPIAPFVVAGIHLAEQLPGATGAQKKEFAMQIAKLAADATAKAKGEPLFNEGRLEALTGSSIDAVVAATNLIHRAPATNATPND